MSTYEIYDSNPMQNPDSRWHDIIRAGTTDGARRQAKVKVRGYSEYPAGTKLWYIVRDQGSMADSGTFLL